MLAIISHEECLYHDAGEYHPDTAERLRAINNQIIMSGLDFVVRHYDAPLATREQLALAHDRAYVDRVFEMAPEMKGCEAAIIFICASTESERTPMRPHGFAQSKTGRCSDFRCGAPSSVIAPQQ